MADERVNARFGKYMPAIWFCLVWPMTLLGYGSDPDAWRLARGAEQIWTTGHYVVSRTLGFPLFELLEAPLVHFGGWYVANLLPLLSGLACLSGMILLSRRGWIRHSVWAPVMFAFHPLVLTCSSSAMDYLPALALLIWAYVFMLEEKWTWSAILVGISIGVRVTSGVFILPVCLYALARKKPPTRALGILALASIVGLLAYSPALLTQGIANPFGRIPRGIAGHLLIVAYNLLGVFGILQSLLLSGILVWAWSRKKIRITPPVGSIPLFHLVHIALGLLLFFVAPYEAAYLLPAFWSTVLLADRLLDRRVLGICAVVVLSYNLVGLGVLGGESGRRKVELSLEAGSTIRDVEDRIFKLSTREAATLYEAAQPTVLMFGEPWIPTSNGAWIFDGDRGMYRQRDGTLYVSERILDAASLRRLKEQGFRVVLWKGEKWEYFAAGRTDLLEQIDIVDPLDGFFGRELEGKSLNQR